MTEPYKPKAEGEVIDLAARSSIRAAVPQAFIKTLQPTTYSDLEHGSENLEMYCTDKNISASFQFQNERDRGKHQGEQGRVGVEENKKEAATICKMASDIPEIGPQPVNHSQALATVLAGQRSPAKKSKLSNSMDGYQPRPRMTEVTRKAHAEKTRKRALEKLGIEEPPMPIEKAQEVVIQAITALSGELDGDGLAKQITKNDVMAKIIRMQLSHDRHVLLALKYHFQNINEFKGDNTGMAMQARAPHAGESSLVQVVRAYFFCCCT